MPGVGIRADAGARAADERFVLALPYVTLCILLVLGALAGGLAAIAPARRASSVDVLQALTHQ